jgi:histidyl-tRNA synthetase
MKIPPVKGTRDFYPEQMRIRNFIIDGWKAVSLRNGFEEYDGPIFEHLKMYQLKSGDEIAEQLFSLTDRGGRELAIRPEITPTLARMVNQKINSLSRPSKWFSVPRLCRAERPQKGRLREFFQWNIDIIGEDNVLADAEVIFTTVDYLREVGLTPNDIKVKISSRKLLSAVLKKIGVPKEKLNPLYTLLDKKSKMPPETFSATLTEQVGDKMSKQIIDFMSSEKVRDIPSIEEGDDSDTALIEIEECESHLRNMGIYDYCVFDPSIVRGLAYYTGIVFEVHDVTGDLRAIGGGGRFDNLLHDFGGPKISATGMGMGDCVLEILLAEKGLLEKQVSGGKQIDCFVSYADEQFKSKAVEITARLRQKRISADFSYKGGNLGKQLREASSRNAARCVIIGSEIENGELVVKDMATGEQKTVKEQEFFESL